MNSSSLLSPSLRRILQKPSRSFQNSGVGADSQSFSLTAGLLPITFPQTYTILYNIYIHVCLHVYLCLDYCNLFKFSSVAQSCPTLCNPMNCSMPGLPVHHQLPEFTQTHIHRVSDAIQTSHPLSSPSPPAPNLSQHQSLFQ